MNEVQKIWAKALANRGFEVLRFVWDPYAELAAVVVVDDAGELYLITPPDREFTAEAIEWLDIVIAQAELMPDWLDITLQGAEYSPVGI